MRSVLKMSSVLLRLPDNRVSQSHHNEIMSIMIVQSKRTYFRTRFVDYLNRKYILTLYARSSTRRKRRSRYRARAVSLHATVRATLAELLRPGT